MVDYGSRIRAVADYLETVPGEKYNYAFPYLTDDGCGCVVAHGINAGVIPNLSYRKGKAWLGFHNHTGLIEVISNTGAGEKAKQTAITNLRAYADKHYPVAANSTKRTGIPASVRQLFEVGEAA